MNTTDAAAAAFDRLATWTGPLPPLDTLPDPYPYETVATDRDDFASRDGVRVWYGVFGTRGPWLVFSPLNQIAHAAAFKAVVPYLSEHFSVLVTDPRGNGRSDRPDAPEAYSFDQCYEDFVAVAGCGWRGPRSGDRQPFEDGVRFSCGTNPRVHRWTRACWFDVDMRPLARELRCPTLVIHGDADARVAIERARASGCIRSRGGWRMKAATSSARPANTICRPFLPCARWMRSWRATF